MEFEWDPRKAASNLEKHGVDFADAVSVLFDELALTVDDEHPTEERFVTIGTDALNRVLGGGLCLEGPRHHSDHLRPQGGNE